jgi:long-chain acyl-CoA synthetase
MCEAFQATVARCPDELALRTVGGAVMITWGDYAGRVRQIAGGLAGLGVGRGDTVASGIRCKRDGRGSGSW